mmetsp:Transcript_85849/g.270582  ORF Transcript_85849/g.270582 Transcript_85849/m.270582 type:complete len:280 (+) Transcript_85849:364-1203(+)
MRTGIGRSPRRRRTRGPRTRSLRRRTTRGWRSSGRPDGSRRARSSCAACAWGGMSWRRASRTMRAIRLASTPCRPRRMALVGRLMRMASGRPMWRHRKRRMRMTGLRRRRRKGRRSSGRLSGCRRACSSLAVRARRPATRRRAPRMMTRARRGGLLRQWSSRTRRSASRGGQRSPDPHSSTSRGSTARSIYTRGRRKPYKWRQRCGGQWPRRGSSLTTRGSSRRRSNTPRACKLTRCRSWRRRSARTGPHLWQRRRGRGRRPKRRRKRIRRREKGRQPQ